MAEATPLNLHFLIIWTNCRHIEVWWNNLWGRQRWRIGGEEKSFIPKMQIELTRTFFVVVFLCDGEGKDNEKLLESGSNLIKCKVNRFQHAKTQEESTKSNYVPVSIEGRRRQCERISKALGEVTNWWQINSCSMNWFVGIHKQCKSGSTRFHRDNNNNKSNETFSTWIKKVSRYLRPQRRMSRKTRRRWCKGGGGELLLQLGKWTRKSQKRPHRDEMRPTWVVFWCRRE